MTDTDSTAGGVDSPNRADDPTWFRYVLGQYPTGVTLITATEPDGTDVGMVVGTFSSVSLDPPLVAFMPDRRSSSWPRIRAAGAFCANILTSAQQDVCRAFARKAEDRFTSSTWSRTTTGSPRLEHAAAWVDCTIENVIQAGDHDIVLGRVTEMGVGDSAALPLLFLRGGYGSFSIPSIESLNNYLPRQVRAVDAARADIESLAADLTLECLVSVAVEDTVVVVSAAGVATSPHGSPSRVGISFQLAAPLAPVHVAWAGAEAQKRWLAATRIILGPVAIEAAEAELVSVRTHGYAVSAGTKAAAEFERTVQASSDSAAPDLSGVLPDLLARTGAGPADLENAREVTSLHAPVFGPDGQVALSLTLNGFTGTETPERLRHCLHRLLEAAGNITAKLGGVAPSD
jgi:flavin reductase (DIM6/NTAB) family NADH-FMN oxidoreductase RutF/DNA-binding IclR family transcriptional regulator